MIVLFRHIQNFKRYQPTFCRNIFLSKKYAKIIQFKLSDIGEGIAEVQLKDWFIKVGDQVKEFDEICTVQSDKATVTITSRYEGVIKKLYHEVDDIAKIGDSLIDIDVQDNNDENQILNSSTIEKQNLTLKNENFESKENNSKKFLATPAVRRLIRENKIDLNFVNGTGKDGRVLKEDILKYMLPINSENSNICEKTSEMKFNASVQSNEQKCVSLNSYTRAMIKSMTEALKIPHFSFCDEYIVDKLIQVRNDINEFNKQNLQKKISYMPLIVKATSIALKSFPILNSSIDEKMNNLVYKNYHNISLAIDSSGGLVVPNIKNCESKTIWEINDELNRLIELGKKQQFTKEDLTDGTFTLSNIGSIGGGTYMNPIIFPPQVAIGAIGKIQKKIFFDQKLNTFSEQNVLNFSWSADHRVIDGATIARFSNQLKKLLENPVLLINEMR